MIVLGVIALIIGALINSNIVVKVGLVLVVIGIILLLLGLPTY